jgi:hypothetical protein
MIMAVINATPDSFSDAGKYATVESRMERTREVLTQGADILDIGGQSAITGVPEISFTLSNMTDRQNYRSTKNFSRSRNQTEEPFKGLTQSQIEEVLEQIWVEDKAEFEWWCWRQVKRGRGLDCSVGAVARTEFRGFKCIKCDFVIVNPGEELLSEESSWTTFVDNLVDGMFDESLDLRDPKTRRARRATCPECGSFCFQNSLPPAYSPLEEIAVFIFRVKRAISTLK